MSATIKELLALGKLIKQERILSDKAREIRRKIQEAAAQKHGFYTSVGHWSDGSLCVHVPLAVYLAANPGAKPKLETYQHNDEPPYGRLEYPAHAIGYYEPGKAMFIQAHSDRFDMPAAPPKEQAV